MTMKKQPKTYFYEKCGALSWHAKMGWVGTSMSKELACACAKKGWVGTSMSKELACACVVKLGV